jgi:hypothetical protein
MSEESKVRGAVAADPAPAEPAWNNVLDPTRAVA